MEPEIKIYEGVCDINWEDFGLSFVVLEDGIAVLEYFKADDVWWCPW